MAERSFTDEQRQAIKLRGGSILVGAAAGSGKTTVLSERIVRMLEDESLKLDASRILVLTFSNAAAAEMRQRIKKYLNGRLKKEPGNRYLKEQQRRMRRARISTVHSFCAQLIRDYFANLDLPLDFAIADDSYAVSLQRRAIEQTMEECYAEMPEEMASFISDFGRARSDKEAAEMVQALYEFETTLAWPEQWEQRVLAEADPDAPFEDTAWGKQSLEMADEILDDARRLAEGVILLGGDEQTDMALTELETVVRMQAYARSGNWTMLSATLDSMTFPTIKYPASLPKEAKEERDAYRAMRERLKKQIDKKLREKTILQFDGDQRRELLEKQYPLLQTLFRMKEKYRANLMALKMERKLLEYDDLETYALKLLYKEPGIFSEAASAVRACYDQIFVDEFQDTNERQRAIFDAISADGKNLFYVGDVKQSIYSFRRADPTIFTAIRDEYERTEGEFPCYLSLPQNFRSSGKVIDAVNAVFDPIMTRSFGGVDYKGSDRLVQGMIPGRPVPPDPIGLELRYTCRDKDEEADMVANWIRNRIREGYPVADEKELRPCRPEDFCILLRTAVNNFERFRTSLEKLGIPCSAPGTEDFFDCSEIRILISLLRVIDNPRRDIDIAAVMLSPISDFTTDDLARLRLEGRRKKLWQILLTQQDEKSVRFVDFIRSLRKKAATLAVEELISLIVTETDAEVKLTAPPEPERRKERIHLLIDYATTFSEYGGRDLRDFLRHCQQAEEQGKGPTVAVSASYGVTITTIHKAKGLEWPIVILADAGHGFNFIDANQGNAFFDARCGCGMKLRMESEVGSYMSDSPSSLVIRQIKKRNTVAEELRVLYVALTRAKQRILVTSTMSARLKDHSGTGLRKEIAKVRAELVEGTVLHSSAVSADCLLDWLLQSFCAAGFSEEIPDDGASEIGPLRLMLDVSGETEEIGTEQEEVGDTEELTDEINDRLDYSYPYEDTAALPTKVSVTQLSHDDTDKAVLLTKPSFARGGRLDAAERGTAVHRFMELCDYQAAAKDPVQEIARLREGQFLEERYAKVIRPEQITGFFSSTIGQKLLNAKEVLREYPFLDQVDASELPDASPDAKGTKVLLQGVADAVLLEDDHAVLLDFKTDRVDDARILADRYRRQLFFYRRSLSAALALPVTECWIWSFHLSEAVQVTFPEDG